MCSDGWEEYLDEDGDVFYYECNGGKSTYEHPCDAYFKWMYTALRQQSMVRSCIMTRHLRSLRRQILARCKTLLLDWRFTVLLQ